MRSHVDRRDREQNQYAGLKETKNVEVESSPIQVCELYTAARSRQRGEGGVAACGCLRVRQR